MTDAISYTQATGKRPSFDAYDAMWHWYTSASGERNADLDVVPAIIFVEMGYRSTYFSKEDALAAADAAYERAVAEGAMGPIEGVG